MTERKIDLVYLWVNGKDEKWQNKKRVLGKMLGRDIVKNSDKCRYSDNEELRYSLRSAQIHAPWINKIFILTDEQKPEWLDETMSDKIKIVDLKEIMPAESLPNFNSAAIETCLCNIPNLSEYFLYSNDDMFFASDVTEDYFFDDNGNPIVNMRPQKWSDDEIKAKLYMQSYLYTVQEFSKKFPVSHNYKKLEIHHCIDPYRKSYFLKCKEEFKDLFNSTLDKKFRDKESFERAIHNLYMIEKCGCKLNINPPVVEQLFEYKVDNLYLALQNIKSMQEVIDTKSPKLLCINDSEETESRDRINLKFLLEKLFPKKQIWERAGKKLKIKPAYNNKQAIVFCLNNAYAKYFAVTLESLIENSDKNKFYDIVLFSSDLSEANQKFLEGMIRKNFSLRIFDPRDFITEILSGYELKSKEYWSVEMYYRIFIPLIMIGYERVLYLDTDMVINKNIDTLFETTFEDNEILAVRDSASPILYLDKNKERLNHIKNVLKISDTEKYFNSGMIMFNTRIIDKENYTERIKNAIKTENLKYPDQDLLNIIFQGKSKLISNVWNYCCGVLIWDKEFLDNIEGEYKKDFLLAKSNPKIIHYSSPLKPWHWGKCSRGKGINVSPPASLNTSGDEHFSVFWNYAKNTPLYSELQKQMKEHQLKEKQKSDFVDETLKALLINEKDIILWGASGFLEEFLTQNNGLKFNILGIIDKNPSRWDKDICGYKIYSPDKISEINPKSVICTIKNNHKQRFEEIKEFFKINHPKIKLIEDVFE